MSWCLSSRTSVLAPSTFRNNPGEDEHVDRPGAGSGAGPARRRSAWKRWSARSRRAVRASADTAAPAVVPVRAAKAPCTLPIHCCRGHAGPGSPVCLHAGEAARGGQPGHEAEKRATSRARAAAWLNSACQSRRSRCSGTGTIRSVSARSSDPAPRHPPPIGTARSARSRISTPWIRRRAGPSSNRGTLPGRGGRPVGGRSLSAGRGRGAEVLGEGHCRPVTGPRPFDEAASSASRLRTAAACAAPVRRQARQPGGKMKSSRAARRRGRTQHRTADLARYHRRRIGVIWLPSRAPRLVSAAPINPRRGSMIQGPELTLRNPCGFAGCDLGTGCGRGGAVFERTGRTLRPMGRHSTWFRPTRPAQDVGTSSMRSWNTGFPGSALRRGARIAVHWGRPGRTRHWSWMSTRAGALQEMATAPWFPASLTKLMTTYVALSKVREGQDHPRHADARLAMRPAWRPRRWASGRARW